MSAVSYEELNELSGDLLPERALLSLINLSISNIGSSSTTYTYPPAAGGQGSTVAYACQATNSPGTPGLLGSLGLGSSSPQSTMTCIPAAITSR